MHGRLSECFGSRTQVRSERLYSLCFLQMPAELQDEQLPLQPEQPQEQLPLFFRIVRMAKPTAIAMANSINISQIFIEPSLPKQNPLWSYII